MGVVNKYYVNSIFYVKYTMLCLVITFFGSFVLDQAGDFSDSVFP